MKNIIVDKIITNGVYHLYAKDIPNDTFMFRMRDINKTFGCFKNDIIKYEKDYIVVSTIYTISKPLIPVSPTSRKLYY